MKNEVNRALAAKKKTYIVPATESVNFANDLMQSPSLSIITGSGAATVSSGDAID